VEGFSTVNLPGYDSCSSAPSSTTYHGAQVPGVLECIRAI